MAQPGRVSIRLLLLAGSAVILLGVLGSTVWLAVAAGRDEADELFDARLATSARVLDSLMARQIEHATLNAPLVMDLPAPIRAGARAHDRALDADADMPLSWRLQDWLFGHHDVESSLGHEYETHIAYQIWSEAADEAAATLLARSSSAPAAPFAPLRKGFSDHTLEDGIWRVFVLHSGDVWIQVAERADAREELSAKLGWATGAPLLIGLLVVLLLTGLLIGYGLAPLSELAERISARRPQDDEPLSLTRVPSEIEPVLSALNGLSSMVGNLIDNAQRYAPSGSAIQVALHARDGQAVLSVSDAGPGIPAELRERVFEPYYRIPGSAGSGSGLGLAIVREVVERLGGQIALLDGAGGHGMRVELTIPLLSER